MQIEIVSNQERNEDGEIENKIGEELIDRNIDSFWKVLITKDSEYGTNWYYVSKGTILKNNQKLENDYVINYETGEVILVNDVVKFRDILGSEQDLHSVDNLILSSDDCLAVKGGLVININSLGINSNDTLKQDDVESLFADNVTLKNFDYNEESGVSEQKLCFDGFDDYIEIDLSNSEINGKNLLQNLEEDGFTIELYGEVIKRKKY